LERRYARRTRGYCPPVDVEDALGPVWPRLRAFCDERIELHAKSIPDPATVLSFELGVYFHGDQEVPRGLID
jgi:hypothetical protein